MNTFDSFREKGSAPRLAELRGIFRERFGFLKDVVDRGSETFGTGWIREFEECVARVFPSEEALSAAAKGYALFVLDLLRAQKKFDKEHTYENKTYAEAAEQVYFDTDYMLSQYLPALLLSHYLWPHHYFQARFFDSAFVAQMQLRQPVRFAEIGVGTGLYSRRVLQQIPWASGVGFDISPAAKGFAEAHLSAFAVRDRYNVALRDVLSEPIEPCEWLVCVEVLEHLEDPVAFLRALRAALRPGGRAFITAALNAPHVDHIYLYQKVEDVIDELRTAGFALEQAFLGAAHLSLDSNAPTPSVAAFIVG